MKSIWTIAANRMKVGKEHRVPLGILSTHQQLGSECFPRRSGAGKNQVCGHAAPPFAFGVTVHGFRSRFRNRAADCTGCAHEVAKMALAQTIENRKQACAGLSARRSFSQAAAAHGRLGGLLLQPWRLEAT